MLLQQHTYKQLGLALNIKKTQVLYLPPPSITVPVSPPNISVNETSLEFVGHFTYFRSLLSPKANIDEEVHLRLNSVFPSGSSAIKFYSTFHFPAAAWPRGGGRASCSDMLQLRRRRRDPPAWPTFFFCLFFSFFFFFVVTLYSFQVRRGMVLPPQSHVSPCHSHSALYEFYGSPGGSLAFPFFSSFVSLGNWGGGDHLPPLGGRTCNPFACNPLQMRLLSFLLFCVRRPLLVSLPEGSQPPVPRR